MGVVLASWVVPTTPGAARDRTGAPAPLQGRLRAALLHHGSGMDRRAACMRVLSPPELRIAETLRGPDGLRLTLGGSREALCKQLQEQSIWPNPWDAGFHAEISDRLPGLVGQARAHRGQGPHDGAVSETEVDRALGTLGPTGATTPDLLPRTVLLLGDTSFRTVVWLLLRLTGPRCLAVRPRGWRGSCAVPLN